jgi:Winged helix-turn helix
VENRPALTLGERCRFLEGVAGVRVSESTLSRLLRRMGFSPKEGRWVRASAKDPWHRAVVLVKIICVSSTGAERRLQAIYGELGMDGAINAEASSLGSGSAK